jgi:deoxyribodipyrimidine photo-lyase
MAEITMRSVPSIRIQKSNEAPVNPKGDYVLYWVIAFRRPRWNFSLQRAVARAAELKKPLLVFEALRSGYPWASDRLHRFILDGMADNALHFKKSPVLYYPYVEPGHDEGKGLLAALAKKACVVITDDYPAFFIPRMVKAASNKLPVLVEAVDSNGLLPLRAADKIYPTAYAFRRSLQKTLPEYLSDKPKQNPLKGFQIPRLDGLPKEIAKQWPPASSALLQGDPEALAAISMDHRVDVVERRGGPAAAHQVMNGFVENRLPQYPENRNHPDEEGASGLSPYLHFGHISVHEVFHHIAEKEVWSLEHLSQKATGGRSGWWGMGEAAEDFLDELITWRELGYNMTWQSDAYDRYESLPDWALKTLADHEKDKRPYVYTLDQLENAQTHDDLWNASQTQLLREGRIHNYLRMLWGKKILEWTATPREALDVMIELNNKYALDGRDPNSYSGIMWVLGRYDRPWGPERRVFGKIRYMSSKNTVRKLRVGEYLEKYKPREDWSNGVLE